MVAREDTRTNSLSTHDSPDTQTKAMVLRALVLGGKTSTMKILHVLHHSVPAPLDGYAIRSHAILLAQQAAGLDVCALTGSQRDAGARENVIDGIRYLRTP